MRLDQFLFSNHQAPSRSKARALVVSGSVLVNGKQELKPSREIKENDVVTVQDATLLRYVSRGGLKLEKALEVFAISLVDAQVLDIGSSTGGFTDCALQHGAQRVEAVDVGTNCMDATLASDPCVFLHEQTDIREAPESCFQNIDYVVCDASFISLPLVLEPAIRRIPQAKIIALIKPQFECGKSFARKHHGVVNDYSMHLQVIGAVQEKLAQLNTKMLKLCVSPISGGDGNIEYLCYCESNSSKHALSADEIEVLVREVFSGVGTHK